MNSNAPTMLKSLFKIRRCGGYESEQAKLKRYHNYFEKMNRKARTTENDLIKELHARCSDNPSIDVHVQELVNKLYETNCGDVNG